MMNKHRTNFDKHWSYHQILRLIDLFRANDVLWDKWNKEYHKNLVKQNVWKDIAAKLGNKTVGSCRTKMENLMTVYRRTKKNLEISIAKGKPVNPTWPYFNHFEVFMKDQFGTEMPPGLDNHQQNYDSQSSDLQYLDPSNHNNDFELEDSKAFLQISYSPPTFEENHNHHQQQQQDQFTTNHQNNHQHLVNHNQNQQEVEEEEEEDDEEDGEVVVEEEPIGNTDCQLQLIESRVLASANVAASHHHQHQPHSNSNQQQPTQTSTSSSKRKRSADNPSSTLSMKNVFEVYQERIQNEPDIVRRSEERIQFLETKLELIEQKHRDELERAKLDYQKELRIQKEIINSIYSEKIQFLEQACKELRKEKNELFQVVIKRLS